MAMTGVLTSFAQNKVFDNLYRGQTNAFPATRYVALIIATRGQSNAIRSAAVSSGDTVIPATPNGRLYKCTTGGTTGSGEPTWPTTNAATVTDGTAVWTEQSTAFEAGTITECVGTNYARVAVTASMANWSGTQSSGSTTASSGSSGLISNNNSILFPAPGSSGTAWGTVFGYTTFDASSGGNMWDFFALNTPQVVNLAAPAPSFSAGTAQVQIQL